MKKEIYGWYKNCVGGWSPITTQPWPARPAPALCIEPSTAEWEALAYCDSCQANVRGKTYTLEDNPTRYCENCWDVVQDLQRDYALDNMGE